MELDPSRRGRGDGARLVADVLDLVPAGRLRRRRGGTRQRRQPARRAARRVRPHRLGPAVPAGRRIACRRGDIERAAGPDSWSTAADRRRVPRPRSPRCARRRTRSSLRRGTERNRRVGRIRQARQCGTAGAGAAVPRAYGLTVTGKLVRFRVNDPAAVTLVGTVGDLGRDDQLVGIDIRPAGARPLRGRRPGRRLHRGQGHRRGHRRGAHRRRPVRPALRRRRRPGRGRAPGGVPRGAEPLVRPGLGHDHPRPLPHLPAEHGRCARVGGAGLHQQRRHWAAPARSRTRSTSSATSWPA